MLQHKDDVEDETDIGQTEFDRIARQTRPVCLQGTVDDQLKKAQKSSREVKKLLPDAPAYC